MKKNRFFLAGLPVIALALGMMITGCDNGSTNDAKGGGSNGAGGGTTGTTGAGGGDNGADNGQELPFAGIVIDGINSTELWNAAITQIKTGGNNKSYRLLITGSFDAAGTSYQFSGVNDATFGTITGLSVEIRGQKTANLTMSLRSSGHILHIGTDQHLTLKDITLRGRTGNFSSLVYVYQGTLEMTGSAAVSGNDTYSYAGGVYLEESELTMNGNAVISDNTAGSVGGGVCLYKSTMTMSGDAAISGNMASLSGGVYLEEGSELTMSGNAAISGNTAEYIGGVYLYESSMTMNGNAAISGNTAEDIGSSGGVYLEGSELTMNGNAIISGNTTGAFGGGIGFEPASNSIFRMAGGTVYGNNEADASKRNTAPGDGASLYLTGGNTAQYGTFTGGAWISNGSLSTSNNTIKVVNGVLLP